MIMCTLLSMVYGLFKPCRLTHVTKDITSLMLHVATCFKETVLLFNMDFSFFVDFIQYQTDKYMSKVNNKKKQINLLNLFKVKNKYSMTSFCFFVAGFHHNQHVNIVFLLLTLNNYLSAECEREVIMFLKQKKRFICSVLKVESTLSFGNLSLRQIEKSYEHMTNV